MFAKIKSIWSSLVSKVCGVFIGIKAKAADVVFVVKTKVVEAMVTVMVRMSESVSSLILVYATTIAVGVLIGRLQMKLVDVVVGMVDAGLLAAGISIPGGFLVVLAAVAVAWVVYDMWTTRRTMRRKQAERDASSAASVTSMAA